MNDPQMMEQARRDYLESRILAAHPTEIIEMLYQVAVDSLREAIEQLKSGDRFARSRAVTRAQEAVHELAVSLDPSVKAPFTHRLAGLYQYVLREITMGHARQSEREFQDALSVLTTLAAGWSEVRRQICDQKTEEAAPKADDEFAGVHSPYDEGVYSAVSSRDWSC